MTDTALTIAGKVKRWLLLLLETGALVCFLIMVVSLILQILFRYVLKVVAPWTEELARFSCIWSVFLGTAVCFEESKHIRIDVIIEKVTRQLINRLLLMINIFVTSTFVAVVIYGSILLLRIGWEDIATTIPIQMGYVYLALPISMVSITIFAILRVFEAVSGRKNRTGAPGESPST